MNLVYTHALLPRRCTGYWHYTQEGIQKLNSPTDFEFWLADAKSAYSEAKGKYDNNLLDISHKEGFYKVAPFIAAARKHIDSDEILQEMMECTTANAQQDFSVDAESKSKYQFHFVIAYVHSHVPPGIFTEMEADRIMDYINDHWDLFEDASG